MEKAETRKAEKEMSKLSVKYVPRETLIPYANNARTHSEHQIKQIAASIKEFGFTNPILIDEDNGIIAGHGRLEAAEILDLTDIPTIKLFGLSDAQKRAYVIADNKLAMNAGWDAELLKLELTQLSDEDFKLELLGFDIGEIEQILGFEPDAKDDVVPDIPEQPATKHGDLWLLGNHRLLCGDAKDGDDIEVLMNQKKANIVFTDPPYGMDLDTDYSGMTGWHSGKKHRAVIGDNVDYDPSHIFSAFGYCNEIMLWGGDYYRKMLPDGGSWFCWDKREDASADKGFGSNFELLWSKKRHKRSMLRYKWFGFFTAGEKRTFLHPTQKPVELLSRVLLEYSEPQAIVVDVFVGSGSMVIAAEKIKRVCYAMEIDPGYVDVAVKRWQDYTGETAKHAETGKPFVPNH